MGSMSHPTNPLTTPTYDGSGQAVHPAVLDFGSGGSWAGYRYWMAMTPYPGGNDYYENPSLLASSDGQSWVVPSGLTNPLDGPPSDYDQWDNHMADSALVHDAGSDTLWVYYVEFHETSNAIWVHCMEVSSSFSKTKHARILTTTATNPILSPTVVREDATHWHMWHTRYPIDGANLGIVYRASSDGLTWGDAQVCTGLVRTTFPAHYPWHVHAEVVGNAVEIVVSTTTNGTSPAPGGKIVKASTTVASPTALTFEAWALLDPLSSGWDSNYLYRASGNSSRLWYSACNTALNWRIGYAVPSVDVWQQATLRNPWVDYDQLTYGFAAFCKDADGWVHLRGLIKNGTPGSGSICLNLPTGYRPDKRWVAQVPSAASPAIGRIDVTADGDVIVVVGSSAWTSLCVPPFYAP